MTHTVRFEQLLVIAQVTLEAGYPGSEMRPAIALVDEARQSLSQDAFFEFLKDIISHADECDSDTRVSYKFEIIDDDGEVKTFTPVLDDPGQFH